MDRVRFKELQKEFSQLRDKWSAAKTTEEREALLKQISRVTRETSEIIHQADVETIRKGIARLG